MGENNRESRNRGGRRDDGGPSLLLAVMLMVIVMSLLVLSLNWGIHPTLYKVLCIAGWAIICIVFYRWWAADR